MGAIILIGLSLTLTSQAPTRSVRTVDPHIQSVIENGIARSATFRSLIDTLADTDVIVYVESRIVRDGLLGLTSHRIIIRGTYRYLRVAIDPHRTVKQRRSSSRTSCSIRSRSLEPSRSDVRRPPTASSPA